MTEKKLSELPVDAVLDPTDLFFVTSSGGISSGLPGQALIDYFVEEAPADGLRYLRSSQSWALIGDYILDCPDNANDYIRTHGSWKLRDPRDSIVFTPLTTEPAHAEGTLFYSSQGSGLVLHTDIPETSLNIGQESWIRVMNNSGAPILNGSACKHGGVSGGLPLVELALADTFENSTVLGVATHDIANGAEGFITTHGSVGGIHTGGHPEGLPMYLSSTIPGGYTIVPPAHATQIGGILVSDPVDGSIFVSIINHVQIQKTLGALLTGDILHDISSSPQDVKDFSSDMNHGLTVDKTNGEITLPYSGVYRVNGIIDIGFDDIGSQKGKTVALHLYDGTSDVEVAYFGLGKNVEVLNCSFNSLFDGIAGKSYRLRISSDITLTTVAVEIAYFDIVSEVLSL